MTASRTFAGHYVGHVQKGLDGEIQVTIALSPEDGRDFLDSLGPVLTAAKRIPVAIVGGEPARALGVIADETRQRPLSLQRRSRYGRN